MISGDNPAEQKTVDVHEYCPSEAHLKGNELFKQKDYQAAIEEYSKEIENSNNSTCLSNRGLCYLNLGKYSLSLKDSLLSFEIDNNQKSITRAVKAAIHLGKLQDAEQYLKKITKQTPAGKESAQLLGKLKSLEGRLESENDSSNALLMIEEMMVTLDPSLYNTRLPNTLSALDTSMTSNIPLSWNLKRAEFLLDLRDANEAGQIGRLILRKDQQNINAIYIVAQSMYMLESHPISTIIQYLSTALSLDPDNKKCRTFYKLIKRLESLKNTGNEGFKDRDYGKALESYSEFLDLVDFGITKAKVLSNRAIVYSRQGLHDQVVDDCNAALSILDTLFFPSEKTLEGKNSLTEDNGNSISGEDRSNTAHAKLYVKLFLRRADAYTKKELFEEAVQDYEIVCTIDPDREYKLALRQAKINLKISKRKDYYKLLGLEKSATDSEIKKGYRKQALLYHPDKVAHQSDEERKISEAKFKEIGEAYSVLGDENKKAMYDRGEDVDGSSASAGQDSNPFGGKQLNLTEGGVRMEDLFGGGGGFGGFGGGGFRGFQQSHGFGGGFGHGHHYD